MSLIYFHNPKCSKSREGLKILEDSHQDFLKKEYLKEEISYNELDSIVQKLNLHPREIIRTKEPLFTELKLDKKELSYKEWINVIISNPILLERPILVSNKSALIARPPSLILNFS